MASSSLSLYSKNEDRKSLDVVIGFPHQVIAHSIGPGEEIATSSLKERKLWRCPFSSGLTWRKSITKKVASYPVVYRTRVRWFFAIESTDHPEYMYLAGMSTAQCMQKMV